MDNKLSQEQIETRIDLINQIKSLDFPILDIGKKIGHTGYLDFIRLDENNYDEELTDNDYPISIKLGYSV